MKILKNLILSVVCILLIATSVYASDVNNSTNGYNINNGTWEIYNADGLKTFRDQVNKGGDNLSLNAKLINDITLNSTLQWVPISNNNNRYNGTFDGNGKTISGLFIDNSAAKFQGLFGRVSSDGVIKNVGIINSSVTASDNVGGIAGFNAGTITNSYVNKSTIIATSNNASIGGFVAFNLGTIASSHVTDATIMAAAKIAYVGGITGINSGGTIIASYVDGAEVSTRDSDTVFGGIVGSNREGEIKASYTENLTIKSAEKLTYSGGIAGENIDGTITTNYFVSDDTTFFGVGINGASASNDNAVRVSSKDGINSVVATMNKALSNTNYKHNIINKTSAPTMFGGNAPSGMLKGAMPAPAGIMTNNSNKTPEPVGHKVASNGTWEIYNAYGLIAFRNHVNSGNASTNALLMDNVILDQTQQWTPISNSTNQYKGTFDGNNHTISGLNTNTVAENQGLFGYVMTGGVIKNLGLIEVNISGSSAVGSIASYNAGTIIASYVDNAEIKGVNKATRTGGIVGYNQGTIIESYINNATIKAVDSATEAGGVAGYNQGSVTASYANNVTISGAYNGGLVGTNDGTIKASYANNITITPSNADKNIGGLVGYNTETITNSYTNNVKITTKDSGVRVGGFAGYSSGAGTLKANYFVSNNASLYGVGNTASNTNATKLATIQELNNNITQLNTGIEYRYKAGTPNVKVNSPTIYKP